MPANKFKVSKSRKRGCEFVRVDSNYLFPFTPKRSFEGILPLILMIFLWGCVWNYCHFQNQSVYLLCPITQVAWVARNQRSHRKKRDIEAELRCYNTKKLSVVGRRSPATNRSLDLLPNGSQSLVTVGHEDQWRKRTNAITSQLTSRAATAIIVDVMRSRLITPPTTTTMTPNCSPSSGTWNGLERRGRGHKVAQVEFGQEQQLNW